MKLFLLTTLLFLASLASTNQQQCGRPRRQSASFWSYRMLGGEEADPHEFPWMTLIKIVDTPSTCGASIISDRWLLTAAHCTPEGRIIALMGRHNVSKLDEPRSKTLSVERIVRHPMYTGDGLQGHDFALLYLNESLTFNGRMRPICLPEPHMCQPSPRDDGSSLVDSFSKGKTIGWGITEAGVTSDVLLKLERSFINNSHCERLLADFTKKPSHPLDDSRFCTQGTLNRSTCPGDSGGPLMGYSNRRYYVIGLVSYGAELCSHPGENPSVYARVCSVVDWIRSEIDPPPAMPTVAVSNHAYLQSHTTRQPVTPAREPHNSRKFRGWFPSAQLGRLSDIQRMLDNRQYIDAQDKDGMTALSWAAKYNQTAVVNHLINSGITVDLPDSYGLTPLMHAVLHEQTAVIRILLNNGANVNAKADAGTPLTLAASMDYSGVAKLLLQNGARVNDADSMGQTAYDAATSSEMKTLLERYGGGPLKPSFRLAPGN